MRNRPKARTLLNLPDSVSILDIEPSTHNCAAHTVLGRIPLSVRHSARSPVTGMLAMVTAFVVMFALCAGQRPADLVGHPAVPAPAVELAAAVGPQDIQTFITALQDAANGAVQNVADAAMLPANGLVDAAEAAQSANTEFFATLINGTDDAQLKALLTSVQAVQQANLGYLITTADDLQGASRFWVDDAASLVRDTLDSAIAATVTSIAGVLGAPLSAAGYTALLGSGIRTAATAASNLVWLVNDALQAPLDLADWAADDLGFAAGYSLANWSDLAAGTLTGLAAQSGLPGVTNLTQALLAVTTTPLSILATGVGDLAYWAPVYTAVVGPQQILYAAANVVAPAVGGLAAVGDAITRIGAAPLDPASYVRSLQGLITAGFNIGSEAIWSGNQIAQIAPLVFNSAVNSTAVVLEAVVQATGHSVSGVLAATGAPAEAVDAPIEAADNLTDGIWNTADDVLDASDAASNWIQDTAESAMAANDAVGEQINAALDGLIADPAPAVSATKHDSLEASSLKAGSAKTGSDKTSDKAGSDKTGGAKAGGAKDSPSGAKKAPPEKKAKAHGSSGSSAKARP
jgi:hypothetical protein